MVVVVLGGVLGGAREIRADSGGVDLDDAAQVCDGVVRVLPCLVKHRAQKIVRRIRRIEFDRVVQIREGAISAYRFCKEPIQECLDRVLRAIALLLGDLLLLDGFDFLTHRVAPLEE